VYLDDVMALANFFPLIPAYDEGNCARFGNCDAGWNIEYAVPYGDAVFSETALFEVFVTAPEEWTVVASGSTIETTPDANGTVTWHIVSGPMRDFNVVLSPRFEVATRQVDDILVNSYYLPEDAEGGRRVLRWSADALALFNELFGPYPYAEFDAVATPTVALGIEYPGLIAMAVRTYADTTGRFQWTTVHEVAHQWWYSLVGNDQQDEPWLDEALTQYSTVLYYELVERWDEAVTAVLEPRYMQVAGTGEDDLISRPVSDYTESNYGPVVYGKGPLFFHALRQELGDEAFYALLGSYFDTYRYKVASGPDLLRLAEQVWGWDLTDLYQEWLGDAADVRP
jgi:aminopeptidase N